MELLGLFTEMKAADKYGGRRRAAPSWKASHLIAFPKNPGRQ